MSSMSTASREWLMVIDLQPAFSHPDSPWFTPTLRDVTARIARLVPAFGGRVLFTRFVPPAEPRGSWVGYYEKAPFALQPRSDWLWPVDAPWRDHPSVSSHTFSKWVPEAYARFGPDPSVVLCGVSTDCCVLMTALAAVDGGAHVRVVADACAAKTQEAHERALAILVSRTAQLEVTTVAEELERAGRAELEPVGQESRA